MELSEADEKLRIIKAAASIIKSDIKLLPNAKEMYPSTVEMESREKNLEYLPKSLLALLDGLFVSKDHSVETASIGQAIMQQVRPKSLLPPLQIGLGVQLHKHFGSRFLIDSMNKHGFTSSYSEVLRFEQSAAMSNATSIPGLSECDANSSHFMQFTADNTDHNLRTLDGHGTFHGIGIIVSVTPTLSAAFKIPRLDDVSTDDLVQLAHVEKHVLPSISRKNNLKFVPLQSIGSLPVDIPTLLWSSTWLRNLSQPLWSGYMQTVTKGDYPGKGSVYFMPMIDMKSTDPVGLLSTMQFFVNQAKKFNMDSVLTFDQPFFWKAIGIKENQDPDSPIKKCVLRLGGFHQLMSFLGMHHRICDAGVWTGSHIPANLCRQYCPKYVRWKTNIQSFTCPYPFVGCTT